MFFLLDLCDPAWHKQTMKQLLCTLKIKRKNGSVATVYELDTSDENIVKKVADVDLNTSFNPGISFVKYRVANAIGMVESGFNLIII